MHFSFEKMGLGAAWCVQYPPLNDLQLMMVVMVLGLKM
jgi:hypothetical protein